MRTVSPASKYSWISCGCSATSPANRDSEVSCTCGSCWYCLNGLSEYCRSLNDAITPGGFTEYTLARSTPDYSFLSPVPDAIDDVTAALMEPTNCAYQIAMKANIKPGDNVVVYGLGAMGIIAAIILRHLGAGAIICVGRRPARQEKARQTGIFDAVVGNDEAGMAVIREICGEHGADVVIEATGTPSVLSQAMTTARYGGRVVAASVYHSTIPEFDPLPIFRRELTIVGAKGPGAFLRSDGSSAVVHMMSLMNPGMYAGGAGAPVRLSDRQRSRGTYADRLSGRRAEQNHCVINERPPAPLSVGSAAKIQKGRFLTANCRKETSFFRLVRQ